MQQETSTEQTFNSARFRLTGGRSAEEVFNQCRNAVSEPIIQDGD